MSIILILLMMLFIAIKKKDIVDYIETMMGKVVADNQR